MEKRDQQITRNTERDVVYLAALLHDIGKFYQRSDDFYDKSKKISEHAKNLAGQICPKSAIGTFTRQHVIWTVDFLEKKQSLFNKIIPPSYGVINDNNTNDNFINLAANHHYPNTELQSIIQLADWWSSAIDRAADVQYTNEPELGRYSYKKQRSYSIFEKLKINGQCQQNSHYAYNLKPLKIDESIFPFEYTEGNDLTLEYEQLWEEFSNEFDLLPVDDYKAFENSLYFLLKKYLWCIPASTNDSLEISLFDHLKITGAMAMCLYDYKMAYPEAFHLWDRYKNLQVSSNHYPIKLWCIDLSGIQNFIYNIASKGANKSLKGRSYYLQLMQDSIINQILAHQDIQATQSHIVYSSGGKTFLLLPNTQKVNDAMHQVEINAAKTIWNDYKSKLYLCFGGVAFNYQKPTNESDKSARLIIRMENIQEAVTLGELWKNALGSASIKKNSKYLNSLRTENEFNTFFEASGTGLAEICELTGEESTRLVLTSEEIDDNEPMSVLPYVLDQVKLGRLLRSHQYQSVTMANNKSNNSKISLLDSDWYIQERINENTNNCFVYQIITKEINYLNNKNGSGNSYGFRYYGGNNVATKNGNILSFEELSADDKNGLDKLGFLRMDVDGLGQVFINGIEADKRSFSAYATLSNKLDLFFSGYINALRNSDKYSQNINIVYSGGDDLFAVGRWDLIIEFAADIRFEFERYVGRPDLTISGGISIVNNKFPIAKAAESAGKAEDCAKLHNYNNQSKNAINIFGININWSFEWSLVVEWKNKLINWIENQYISKGLLHNMMDWYEINRSSNGTDLSWRWNAAYQLTRQKDSANNNNKKIEAIDELIKLLVTEFSPERFRFEAFIVAVRWAELCCKKSK